ncbi:MAG: response regulator [Bacteriovoracaceae bacterium]
MIPIGKRFLIVDDFETIRQAVKSTLDELALDGQYFDSDTVAEAKDVLMKQSEAGEPIEFIICDWNMPGGNGIELLKWVKKFDSFKGIPFMLLTTENEAAKVLQAIEAGVDNYCIKPWKAPDFLKRITECWKKHH